jgi:membrane-bound ClpP family serine protease
MNRATLLTTVVAGAAFVGAGLLAGRVAQAPTLPPDVVLLVAPYIDLGVAEAVLAALERVPDGRATIVLHTAGGCVTACVLIANALRRLRDSTAVVPYMALSGGTLIALAASRIEMGERASLSAVDPVILGQQVRHLDLDTDKRGLAALSRDVAASMRGLVRELLGDHLREPQMERALSRLMGDHVPHGWPLPRDEVAAFGLPVAAATPKWAAVVDRTRRNLW